MKGSFKDSVNPKIVAIAILMTLGAIQWWWWQALVAKRSAPTGPPRGQQGVPSREMTLYIAGNPNAVVETIAGTVEPGFEDGPGYSARFDGPSGLMLEKSGSLLVADTRNHRLRRVSPDGTTSTVAGGQPGFRDGDAAQSSFTFPCAIRSESGDSTLILDAGNRRIRSLAGVLVTTVGEFPTLADAWKSFIKETQPIQARVARPDGDTGRENLLLQSVNISSPVGNSLAGADDRHSALFLLRSGTAEVIAGMFTPLKRMDGWADGKGDEARFGRIGGIASADSRTIYVADTSNNCIRRITLPEGD